VAGTIALGCIATSSVLTVTSCSFKYLGASATLLTIAGEEKIRATTGEAGNSSFTATDNLGNDDTDSAT
jgi:hypothetical protein